MHELLSQGCAIGQGMVFNLPGLNRVSNLVRVCPNYKQGITRLHIQVPGGVLPNMGYRYVRPQRVGFFSRFGHKLGIDFGYFAAILVINRETIFAL